MCVCVRSHCHRQQRRRRRALVCARTASDLSAAECARTKRAARLPPPPQRRATRYERRARSLARTHARTHTRTQSERPLPPGESSRVGSDLCAAQSVRRRRASAQLAERYATQRNGTSLDVDEEAHVRLKLLFEASGHCATHMSDAQAQERASPLLCERAADAFRSLRTQSLFAALRLPFTFRTSHARTSLLLPVRRGSLRFLRSHSFLQPKMSAIRPQIYVTLRYVSSVHRPAQLCRRPSFARVPICGRRRSGDRTEVRTSNRTI